MELLAFLDDDAVPEPTWLEHLLAEFADPLVALVSGRILPPEADMHLLPVYAWFGFRDLGEERRVFDRQTPHWFDLTNFGGVGLGGSFALRRSALDRWQGFDERLGAGTPICGYEEMKAFFELVDFGFRLVYAPKALVRHPYPHEREQLRRRALRAIEASTAYPLLLLCEKPAFRKETLRHLRRKLGRLAPRHAGEVGGEEPLLPRYRILAARLKGVWLYLATRLKGV